MIWEWANKVRQQWTKLLALLCWTRKKKSSTGLEENSLSAGELAHFRGVLQHHDRLLETSVEFLQGANLRTRILKVPVYDVATAVDVFTSGEYLRLPACIRRCTKSSQMMLTNNETDLQDVYSHLHDLIQFRLFSGDIPKPYSNIQIANGRAYCEVENEFSIEITLIREDIIYWHVISLKIFVQTANSSSNLVQDSTSQDLVNLVQHHVFSSEDPLKKIYEIVHHFCLSLGFNVLLEQTKLFVLAKENFFCFKQTQNSLIIYYWTNGNQFENLDNENIMNKLDSICISWISPGEGISNELNPHLAIIHNSIKSDQVPTKTISLSAISIEQILLEILSSQAKNLLYTLHQLLLKNISHLPLHSDHIKIKSNEIDKIYETHIEILLFSNEILTISVDNFTGKFTLELINDQNNHILDVSPTLLDEITIIIFKLKQNAIISHIKDYMNHLSYTFFSKLPLQYPEDITFKFSENSLFFKLNGWVPLTLDASGQRTRTRFCGYVVIELTKLFRLNIYFLSTKSDFINVSNQILVDQIHIISQNLWISNFNVPDSLISKLAPNDNTNTNTNNGTTTTNNNRVINFNLSVTSHTSATNSSATNDLGKLSYLHFSISSGSLHDTLDNVTTRCKRLLAQLVYVGRNTKYEPKFVQDFVEFVSKSRSTVRKVSLGFNETKDQWETNITLAENQLITPSHIDPDDRVYYFPNISVLRVLFKNSSHDNFMQPWQEIFRINAIAALSTQWEQICKSSDPESEQLRNQFKLFNHKYSHISFSYTLFNGEQKILTIEHERRYIITGPNLFKKFLESKLSIEKNLKSILQIIGRSTYPLQLIRNLWKPSSIILATDFCMIPLVQNLLRIVYRKKFAIDVRFVHDNFIRITDASRSLFSPATHPSSYLSPLLGLQSIIKKDHNQSIPGDNDLVPFSNLPEILSLIHKLFGCNYLFDKIANILTDNKVKQNKKTQNLTLKF